jgi:hypothetical protein
MTITPRPAVRANLQRRLDAFERAEGPLPGLNADSRASLLEQLVDSVRRNQFVEYLTTANLSGSALDPTDSDRFDPLRAAALLHRRGEDDEAFWMLFLFIHFGKHRRSGYGYARALYGSLGNGHAWTWTRIVDDLPGFQSWLDVNADALAATIGGYGNHRKYESITHLGDVVASYVRWVGTPPLHRPLFDQALVDAGNDPELAFAALYKSMRAVHRFGRIARFDYLSMAGKLGLADIQPDKAYFQDSSGPRRGAVLLFTPHDANTPASKLEEHAAQLRDYLAVPADVIEDALCNWQKTPDRFTPFRG